MNSHKVTFFSPSLSCRTFLLRMRRSFRFNRTADGSKSRRRKLDRSSVDMVRTNSAVSSFINGQTNLGFLSKQRSLRDRRIPASADRSSDGNSSMECSLHRRRRVLVRRESSVVQSTEDQKIKKIGFVHPTVSMRTGSVRTGGTRYCSLTRFWQPRRVIVEISKR